MVGWIIFLTKLLQAQLQKITTWKKKWRAQKQPRSRHKKLRENQEGGRSLEILGEKVLHLSKLYPAPAKLNQTSKLLSIDAGSLLLWMSAKSKQKLEIYYPVLLFFKTLAGYCLGLLCPFYALKLIKMHKAPQKGQLPSSPPTLATSQQCQKYNSN